METSGEIIFEAGGGGRSKEVRKLAQVCRVGFAGRVLVPDWFDARHKYATALSHAAYLRQLH